MKINNYNLMDQYISKDSTKLENSKDHQALMEAAKEFESIFLYMMMKEMKNTLGDGGLVEKSQASKIFEDMYLDELSKEVASGDQGIGLAKEIYNQMKDNIII